MSTDTLINTGVNALSGAMAGRAGTLANQMNGSADLEKARESAESFESMFLTQMLQPMFNTVDTGGLFGGGSAEKMWRSMMVEEYGKMVTENGGIGIADSVMQVMIANQEA